LASGQWTGIWIYFTAPPLGMLLAAEAFVRSHGISRTTCAKYRHDDAYRCIFCNHQAEQRRLLASTPKHTQMNEVVTTNARSTIGV
jgi:aquaporin Z